MFDKYTAQQITKYCFLKKQADKVKKHIINKIPHCSA